LAISGKMVALFSLAVLGHKKAAKIRL